MTADITISQHALERMRQRGFSLADIYLALDRGIELYAQNSLYYFLGRRHLADLGNLRESLEGLTLVFDPKSLTLLTCFRNRRFLKKIRHKK